MSILINKNTRVIVQGITGKQGKIHTYKCIKYGTKIVAGITPTIKKKTIYGLPLYTNIKSAKRKHKIDASIIFVPAPYCKDAILEAINNKIKIIICITEGIPVLDMMIIKEYIKNNKSITLIGPNCPGIITPMHSKIGIMPSEIHKKGNIGIVSRSGTLTYTIVEEITNIGFGQSTCVGIGGDPIIGTNFKKIIKLFIKDKKTKIIILIGEIGGYEEEKAALYIRKKNIKKPILAYIAGLSAPIGKTMGHAGAIISNNSQTAKNKIKILQKANVKIIKSINNLKKILLKIKKKLKII